VYVYASPMDNLDAFTRDCFHAIIRAREACANPEADVIGRHIDTRDHIDRMIGRALAAGISRYDAYAATYAIVVLADTTLMRDKGAMGRYWREHPLEAHYFADGKRNEDDTFYDRLEDARRNQRLDVVRVYATCMALGYRGRLHGAESERLLSELQALVEPTTWAHGAAPVLPQPRLRDALNPMWLSLAALMISLVIYAVCGASVRAHAAALTGSIDARAQGSE
jgi:type IV/VI secretion system ImpK/VasF family protein